MSIQPGSATNHGRIVAGLPLVHAVARRLATSMPHSVEIGDLIQDGVLGLIDAAHRFDETRGIKFETFAERRVRGAMIDALRRHAWPRAVRRQRRELGEARDALRAECGHQPSMADLAARIGVDEQQLVRTMVRINTIEATSPLTAGEPHFAERLLPTVLRPSPPESPDRALEKAQVRERIRHAVASLPAREQRVIGMYYDQDVTMKAIGAAIGVNESRVSQLHARAIGRLRTALGDMRPSPAAAAKAPVTFAPQNALAAAPGETGVAGHRRPFQRRYQHSLRRNDSAPSPFAECQQGEVTGQWCAESRGQK
jgi:RNA polymerase sigma factor for flagellar operon FliA